MTYNNDNEELAHKKDLFESLDVLGRAVLQPRANSLFRNRWQQHQRVLGARRASLLQVSFQRQQYEDIEHRSSDGRGESRPGEREFLRPPPHALPGLDEQNPVSLSALVRQFRAHRPGLQRERQGRHC